VEVRRVGFHAGRLQALELFAPVALR